LTPLFEKVSPRAYEKFLSIIDQSKTFQGPEYDRETVHIGGYGKFDRSMIAFRKDGECFVVNQLGLETLGDPLPLLGDE
jgi:hypothetical protein